MELTKAILSRRTHRKFNGKKVQTSDLLKLIEYARFAPMGANIQPLKYMIINDEKLVQKVFPYTKWSGYEPQHAPTESQMPTAYIAMLGDTTLKSDGKFEIDAGAAGTIISLAAEDLGISSCWLGSVDRVNVSKLLNLDEKYKLLYLIAFGYSDQKSVSFDAKDSIKYYTDENGTLNVPKRTLDEILVKNEEK